MEVPAPVSLNLNESEGGRLIATRPLHGLLPTEWHDLKCQRERTLNEPSK